MKKIFSVIIVLIYFVVFAWFITRILPQPYSMILSVLNGIATGIMLQKIKYK